uniref:(northern house mosquito) hypothetical protein n=1 Tax=Culex pipiens TaxID=7175 RepID=A0A8D8FGS0_CULPI
MLVTSGKLSLNRVMVLWYSSSTNSLSNFFEEQLKLPNSLKQDSNSRPSSISKQSANFAGSEKSFLNNLAVLLFPLPFVCGLLTRTLKAFSKATERRFFSCKTAGLVRVGPLAICCALCFITYSPILIVECMYESPIS